MGLKCLLMKSYTVPSRDDASTKVRRRRQMLDASHELINFWLSARDKRLNLDAEGTIGDVQNIQHSAHLRLRQTSFLDIHKI